MVNGLVVDPKKALYVVLSVENLQHMIGRIEKEHTDTGQTFRPESCGVFYTRLSGAEWPDQLDCFQLVQCDKNNEISESA